VLKDERKEKRQGGVDGVLRRMEKERCRDGKRRRRRRREEEEEAR
jgi:hypothetical protein